MKTMPKSIKSVKNTFKNDEIEATKMNYIVGGGGPDGGGEGGVGEW